MSHRRAPLSAAAMALFVAAASGHAEPLQPPWWMAIPELNSRHISCLVPTQNDVRFHRTVTVEAMITGLADSGKLYADQIACAHQINVVIKDESAARQLRSLTKRAFGKSHGGRLFLVVVDLSGPVSRTRAFPKEQGPANVTLTANRAMDATVVDATANLGLIRQLGEHR